MTEILCPPVSLSSPPTVNRVWRFAPPTSSCEERFDLKGRLMVMSSSLLKGGLKASNLNPLPASGNYFQTN